jgi:hypothetical protein
MAALLLPGPVMAGTYQMNQCMAASSRTLSSSWGLFGGIPDAKVFNSCGAGGEFGLTEANSMTYNTVGGLNLTVPDIRPNVTITHVDAEVATAAETASQYSFFRLSGEGQVIFDQEMTGWYHAVGSDLPATRDLQLGIYCSYGNGPQNCSWRSYPVISVGRLSLTLHEDGPPTARPTGGTLMSGTPVSGSQTLSYAASDSDSGVRAVSVQLGDTIVGSDDYETACTYDNWNACPTQQDGNDMSVDTTRVPDGTYPLKLVVSDAAGNTATVDSGRIVTVSSPRAKGPGAARKTTNVQLVVGQGQSRALRTSYGRKLVIVGQVLDATGNPLMNAAVNVSSQIAQAGHDFGDVGEAETDTNGNFAFSVPPGPNRTLRFSYTSPVSAGLQAKGQADLVLQVRAGAHLTASDRKVAGGRRVTFRGQLDGGPIPASGVAIGFRGQVGKHVRKFGDTQTDDHGRFRLTYKMPAAGPRKANYAIWVRIGADGDAYPYLPGLSNRVRITVLR